ncbi:MAG: hypothetical protein ABIE22_03890 [archaeon]
MHENLVEESVLKCTTCDRYFPKQAEAEAEKHAARPRPEVLPAGTVFLNRKREYVILASGDVAVSQNNHQNIYPSVRTWPDGERIWMRTGLISVTEDNEGLAGTVRGGSRRLSAEEVADLRALSSVFEENYLMAVGDGK